MSKRENTYVDSHDPLPPGKSLGSFLIPDLHTEALVFLEKAIKQVVETDPEYRFDLFSSMLLQWSASANAPTFLLPSLLFFIAQINRKSLLDDPYHFSDLEWWLVFKADYSLEEELNLRAKIAGKSLGRDAYQLYFPIGNGKFWEGIHVVTAHPNPDLDTLVCSFWGWLDAFAAKVGNRLHIWNIPGNKINSTDLAFLDSFLGKDHYKFLCKRMDHLDVNAMHVSTPCPILKENNFFFDDRASEPRCSFVVAVDEQGFYLGEWGPADTEEFFQLTIPLTHLLEWFEMYVRSELLRYFSSQQLDQSTMDQLITKIKGIKIHELPVLQRYTEHIQIRMFKSLKIALGIDRNASLEEFAIALADCSVPHLLAFLSQWTQLCSSPGSAEHLSQAERHVILSSLHNLLSCFNGLTAAWSQWLSSVKIALQLKEKVWNRLPRWTTTRTALEQVRHQLASTSERGPITVVRLNRQGKKIPVGMIFLEAHKTLGTVSLRDFSNREDLSISSSLQVISVIDHHKSELLTKTPSTIIVGDVQACSVLVTEMEMALRDYHVRGDTNAHIDSNRERTFAISVLAAIFDDTDLLEKAKNRDLLAAYRLLQVLAPEQHPEHLWHQNPSLADRKRMILQSSVSYSIYSKFFDLRKQAISEMLRNSRIKDDKNLDDLFSDTKKQGCGVLVGQSKLFLDNWQDLQKLHGSVIYSWLNYCKGKATKTTPFCLHLMSTILSAEQMLKEESHPEEHRDEMWLWVNTGQRTKAMQIFLEQLLEKELEKTTTSMQLVNGNLIEDYIHPLTNLCMSVNEIETNDFKESLIILRFKAGILNSRKGSITPYIPTEHL